MYDEVLDGAASFEMHFKTMFPADVLAAFTHSFNIGHHHVGIIAVEACVVPDVTGILAGSVRFLLFYIVPAQSPYWIHVSFQYLFEVMFFLFK